MKRGDEQLDVFSSMFSKRSDPNMLHPNSEDESVNSLSQESHDPVLETRVLRYLIDQGYVVIVKLIIFSFLP